ncbi:MAG: 16S rRNA (guanine(966)-N(2))-methyltransferase RsmD [Desulfomonile tiedjei]|nr:16S rRNA (guanine(966)-N(2))-methyltransferase RsmD [Desulfomonile tiedjei]
MRIIAGRFRGVRLIVPRGRAVRPTTDRVREAVFSMLGPLVEESRVLELFAGTGAFGLEALSRGAAFAVFVENDRKTVETLVRNVQTLGLEERAVVLALSVTKALQRLAAAEDRFRIVYLDPPYATDWIDRVVSDPFFPNLLEAEGLLVVERGVRSAVPTLPRAFVKDVTRKYGGTMIEIFRLGTEKR